MLIRQIQADDNEMVANIIRSVMTEFGAVGPGFSIEDPEVDRMFEAYSDPRSRFYVFQNSQGLQGCGGIAQLAGADAKICELKKMYFLPEARGQGAGRLLAEMLIQDARRMGYLRLYIETLETMAIANRLYQKLGFVPIEGGLGNTGHCGCDTYYSMDLEPIEIDPSLLG